jgi:tripartite-type tricarboxylate transporter receptor subunit TctC
VHKINADLHTVLTRADVVKKIEDLGNYTRPMSPQQLADFVRDERRTWGPIARQFAATGQ